MEKSYGIHWFRRDLRVAGNSALQWSWNRHHGRVLGFFCFDKKFLSRSDFSVNRFQFFLHSLMELRKELRSIGGDLLCLDTGPSESFPRLLDALEKTPPETVSFSRDYEPFARKRDEAISSILGERGIQVFHQRDHLVIEPEELTKSDGSGYQVFTPFSRKWLELFRSEPFQTRVNSQAGGLRYLEKLQEGKLDCVFSLKWKSVLPKNKLSDVLDEYVNENRRQVTVEIPPAGSLAALAALKAFEPKLPEYGNQRDIPSIEGTSKLSFFFKNGSLTVPQVIHFLQLEPYGKGDKRGAAKYFGELIWREFYYHILYRHPEVERESFNPKYRNLKWENNKKYFEAWKKGLTGYPIVDAGMRQLSTTGWMHNRVRMIVASFLTKDLLIDWRWGERYFMEQLLDGDLAPNNGGWQWAASTGCDAQPYFRIFNPKSQSERFDPQGDYIRKYVPELANLGPKEIHDPPEEARRAYVMPIVSHKEQRERALEIYLE